MDVYEKTLYDHLNDLYNKIYKSYLDAKISFNEWQAYKNKLQNIIKTIIIIEKSCQDQTS